ncbi:MAG TPA: hypothetical protein VFU41_15230 [Gemmatimonadales bacterium]|nr:hypothetical protein [Gemmatimonadales bacterium]
MPSSNTVPAAVPRQSPRPPLRREPPARTEDDRSRTRRWPVLFMAVVGAICLAGAPYYVLPIVQRVRHPLHSWLKPSGYVGQSAGLLALAIFVFLWLYPLRKKFRWLAFTGAIARWLDVHVLAALSLPLLVAVHAAWRFTGVIGLGFWSMMVVWLSGIVGRYLYARIPRSKQGVELTMDEIGARRKALLEQIARESGLDLSLVETTLAAGGGPATGLGIWGTLKRLVTDDLARRRAARRLRRLWKARGRRERAENREAIETVLRLARHEMALTQQARMLDATHRVFRFWHVFHRPVAIAALVAVLAHVAIVVALGATWLW